MKKRNVLLICCSILLVLAGCEKKENANELHQGNETVQQESLNENDEAKEEPVEVNIYKINPDNEERVIEVKECEELNETILWEFLKEAKVVPEESNALSLEVKGNQLELDVDIAFGEWLRSFGTTGEKEIISCVVNTYLDAYQADEIKITEEGQTLYSGHTEYTEYLRKFE